MEIIKKEPIGAEVRDIKVRRLDYNQVLKIKWLLSKHGVLIFRNQKINDEDFEDFLRKLGPLTFTIGEKAVNGFKNLNIVSNVGRDSPPKSSFHTDSSYFLKPPAYTALRAVKIPKNGGDTLFTNQYLAYKTLPKHLVEKLSLKAIKHEISGIAIAEHKNTETSAYHPIFFKHPISKKTALFLSTPKRCKKIKGLSTQESFEIVDICYSHSIRDNYIYRHKWQEGDLIIWDNGCTLHKADHSNVSGDRILHRGLSLGYNA